MRKVRFTEYWIAQRWSLVEGFCMLHFHLFSFYCVEKQVWQKVVINYKTTMSCSYIIIDPQFAISNSNWVDCGLWVWVWDVRVAKVSVSVSSYFTLLLELTQQSFPGSNPSFTDSYPSEMDSSMTLSRQGAWGRIHTLAKAHMSLSQQKINYSPKCMLYAHPFSLVWNHNTSRTLQTFILFSLL